ncbi:MAG: CopD family protein [Haloglomus sp.]
MALVDATAYAIHLLVGALWTGSVLFAAWAVLPAARAGEVRPGPLETVFGRLTTLSRGSAVVMLLTGGHMAAQLYSFAGLTGRPRGHLVLTMTLLWLVLAALVEVGNARMQDGLEAKKVRTPAQEAGRFYRAAGVVALLLLVDAGVLAANSAGLVAL